MKRDRLELYVHLVWATWDRLPFIIAEIERPVHRVIQSEAHDLGCSVLAVDGIPDHVHMLAKIPSTLAVADLVRQVKGVSSRFVNNQLRPDYEFKWQGRYGAFAVSRWDIDKITAYIRGQKEHHASGQLWAELEETFEDLIIPAVVHKA